MAGEASRVHVGPGVREVPQVEGVAWERAADLDALAASLSADSAAVVLADLSGADALVAALEQQPPWSDLPIVVVGAHAGAERLGNVVRVPADGALAGAVRDALRARRRQWRARDLWEAADRRADDLVSSMGHELRNPLSAMSNIVYLLKRPSDPAATLRLAERLERQVRTMVQLVDDTLDYSRVGRGRIQLERGPVAVGGPVGRAIEATAATARLHGVTVERGPDELAVDADADRLAQVLRLLLEHAIRRSTNGGRVWIDASAEGAEGRLRVVDSGTELPQAATLFDASAAPGAERLGLALARRLIELHGGRISASSADGGGLAIVVHLPLAASGPPAPA